MKSLKGFVVVAFVCVSSNSLFAGDRVINGTVVMPGEAPQVVVIKSQDGQCTATLVGPQVILTAAHCAQDAGQVSFMFDGKQYHATITRSPFYNNSFHDVAAGLIDQPVANVVPAFLGHQVDVGDELLMYGYGCTQAGGGGGNDGNLRRGSAPVVGYVDGDIVTKGENAICFGDSGGPLLRGGEVVGIGSKGDIRDTSYFANLTSEQSVKFLESFAATQKVDICGINSNCP